MIKLWITFVWSLSIANVVGEKLMWKMNSVAQEKEKETIELNNNVNWAILYKA
jgi:hypothetical protein